MAKLTDLQKKQIIADRVNGMSFRTLADKYNVSTTTVQRIVKSDSQVTQKVTQKKEQNVTEIIAHMDDMKNSVCKTLDKLLSAISDDEKISKASVNQLATTMGILIDKFTANENVSPAPPEQQNNLLDIIRKSAVNINSEETESEIRGIEPEANNGNALVGDAEI